MKLEPYSYKLPEPIDISTIIAAVLGAVWPIGSIFMSVSADNPSAIFGGTWVAWGRGRVPVSVNTSGIFASVEATGGAETVTLTTAQVPNHGHTATAGDDNTQHTHSFAHTHTIAHTHTYYANVQHIDGTIVSSESLTCGIQGGGRRRYVDVTQGSSAASSGAASTSTTGGRSAYHQHAITVAATSGGGSAHTNLQPYITCYMWKRTA